MTQSTPQLAEHFFRHQYGQLVAVLCRAHGTAALPAVEDAVQEALLRAMQTWPSRGIPRQPGAWLAQVARRCLIDHHRAQGRRDRHRAAQCAAASDAPFSDAPASVEQCVDQWLAEERLPDSLLRMMFVCCDPAIDDDSQLVLILKILCGFSVEEIARGMLRKPDAVRKRLQRARRRLIDANWQLELPADAALDARLDSVHRALYLMFSEGHSASCGDQPVRESLCEEAARLCHLLARHPLGSDGSRALLALMLFHAARLPARVDARGESVLLADQDRSLWDRRLIDFAWLWLRRAGGGASTRWHLEAGIAAFHCSADSVAETDWARIVALYDLLIARCGASPVYRLNRAVARAQGGDARTALAELEALRAEPAFADYALLDCAIAHVQRGLGDTEAASAALARALKKPLAAHQRRWLDSMLG